MDTTRYEVVIIGGGAAGLSAALTLSRALRSVLVVDAGTPRNALAAGVHGYLSRDGMNPGNSCPSVAARCFPTEEQLLTAKPFRRGEPLVDLK